MQLLAVGTCNTGTGAESESSTSNEHTIRQLKKLTSANDISTLLSFHCVNFVHYSFNYSLQPLEFQCLSLPICWERNIVALNFIEKAGRICQWGSWVQCWCCVVNVFALAVIEGISSFVVVCWDCRLLDFESILANLLMHKSKAVRNSSLST